MARVGGKNTAPEREVRRALHALGYRYRLHDRALPGKPDIVFGARRKVIMVHGCFWHRHSDCPFARIPKSRVKFWTEKLEGNRRRDQHVVERLQSLGWAVLVIWECEIRDRAHLNARLRAFLGPTRASVP
ncbi:very short patch repair endonuclease [Massilia sp. TS11]|nr:very short patch repair endonuclease [Massilia sp. TS11]